MGIAFPSRATAPRLGVRSKARDGHTAGEETGMPRAHTAVERLPHTEFTGSYPGHPIQVQRVRHDVRAALDGHPAVDDVVLIMSELSSNAVLHSQSLGVTFDVHVEVYPAYVWIEVIDRGGDWLVGPPGDHGRGLVLVEMLAGGPGNWGTECTVSGQRVVWVRLEMP
jgi:hypothetical protein